MLSNCNNSKDSFDLMVKYIDEKLVSKLKLLQNKETFRSKMERTLTQMILNTVLPRKAEPMITTTAVTPLNGICRRPPLSQLLEDVFERNRQTDVVYESKLKLRQKIYCLLTKQMTERIDLFLIGSSLTNLGSNCSDTDLCLIIYDSDNQIDSKYEERDAVLSKLDELDKIFEINGMSSKAQVIPALVPILKFIETSTNIEVNINVNRLVTIRNTHLLHVYSLMDKRVAKLILTIKLWAKKNGINSAFNKSLTSYSISLMVIHFLQNACSPPVVPVLQRDFPQLFSGDVTRLRLNNGSGLLFKSANNQSLGQLFTQFFEYYCLYFNFDKVISVRSGALLDKEVLVCRTEPQVWQWKCHICIEEPFIGTNTSHAVHNCQMFRQILQKFMDTYQLLISGTFIP